MRWLGYVGKLPGHPEAFTREVRTMKLLTIAALLAGAGSVSTRPNALSLSIRY
jgi:hypothetical protein